MPQLEVKDFSVHVHLGCTQKEREKAQEVRISINLVFPEAPPACATDQLKDTICYAHLCSALKDVCTQNEFCTIERLTSVMMGELKKLLSPTIVITLRVHKVRPPIDGLFGGVIFELEGFP